MNSNGILDISWATVFKIFLVVVFLYTIFSIKEILIWFVFALIISILFEPIVSFLGKLKIPRILGIIFVFVFIFGIIALLIYLTAPLFISEVQQFSKVLPGYLTKIFPILSEIGGKTFEEVETAMDIVQKALETATTSIFNVLFAIFGGIFSTIFIIAVAIFLTLEEKAVEKTLILFFPRNYEDFIVALWRRCQKKVSGWFWTRVVACLFVGAASFLAFLVLNLEYPLSLALLAGVLNFIPFVGPFLTGILLFLIVFPESVLQAVFVVIILSLIQLIENSFLTPILSQKFVGLSPVLVLISLAIGGKLWGFLGAVLAIPLAGILFEFLKDYLKKRREKEV